MWGTSGSGGGWDTGGSTWDTGAPSGEATDTSWGGNGERVLDRVPPWTTLQIAAGAMTETLVDGAQAEGVQTSLKLALREGSPHPAGSSLCLALTGDNLHPARSTLHLAMASRSLSPSRLARRATSVPGPMAPTKPRGVRTPSPLLVLTSALQ